MSDDREAQVIEIWKTVVSVQQHFNDISMRIRGLFITIILGLFAAIGFLIDKPLSLEIFTLRIQFSTLLPAFGIVGAYLFYFIDRYWYHRLLVGAVKHGIKIEQAHKTKLPEIALTDSIGLESPYKPAGLIRVLAKLVVSHEKFKETGLLHSDGKIEFFYKLIMVLLLLTSFLLALLGGASFEGSSLNDGQPSQAPVTGAKIGDDGVAKVPGSGN